MAVGKIAGEFEYLSLRLIVLTSSIYQDREQSFTVMVREWRDLQKLLRSGRGHDPGGVSSTKPGELAIQCRACPHPDINLPDDFANVPDHLQYLYWLNVAVDCNFHLKNRHRSTNNIDVRLSPGLAYVIDHEPYLQHVRQFATQEEVRLCPWNLFNYEVHASLADEHMRWLSSHATGESQTSERVECDRGCGCSL